MNRRQLEKLGVPGDCVPAAQRGLQAAVAGGLRGKDAQAMLQSVLQDPDAHASDPYFADFAQALQEAGDVAEACAPVAYRTWGSDIDVVAHDQMRHACALPVTRGAALMPDAHVGYGLPIGGVLATENAVIPYAVGVDIACRMKLSVLDLPPAVFDKQPQRLDHALERGTVFGVGGEQRRPQQHPVMDRDWTVTRITREHRDKAWRQLGTSGSGNHFVEFGLLSVTEDQATWGLPAGQYVALLSHSGSRGVGAAVCSTYSNIARQRLPRKYASAERLAWLTLDSEAGQEYWAAMNLMGDYAAANHDVIHRLVAELVDAQILAGIENHHNFAWKETHGGRELIVHRKGATPAGAGVLGVIPGSMGTPAYLVRGQGEPASLDSASHGAGRCMSRTAAKSKYRIQHVVADLAKKGVRVLSAGSDEVPYVYKDIEQVMRAQRDLVQVVGRFDPRVVKMCGDDSRAED